jgi:small subunit ribosomal protein S4
VNGARVDRPSYRVQPGDVVSVSDRSRNKKNFQVAAAGANAPEMIPPYLQVNHGDLMFRLERPPVRSEIPVICDEQLVVEYYSR